MLEKGFDLGVYFYKKKKKKQGRQAAVYHRVSLFRSL